MKNKLKNEMGSITTMVTVTIIFFITILSAAYIISTVQRKAQLESELLTRETYEKDFENINEIYNSLKANSSN